MSTTETVTPVAPLRPEQRPIFFLHIPKTGGNTVIAHFLAFLPVSQVLPPPPQLTLLDGDLAAVPAQLPQLRFLHGHVRVSLPGLLPLADLNLITFIRHPVKLVASHYLYFRYMPELPMHAAAKALPIDDFLRRYPSYGTNPQTRYLSLALGLQRGFADEEPKTAVPALLKHFDFVGVTERMEDSLTALSEHYGLPHFPPGRLNAGRASRDEVEATEAVLRRDEFLLRLGADLELRREAERRLEEWYRQRAARRASLSLLEGLRGTRPMPWVLARSSNAALTFLDGWLPQGWVGEPRDGNEYWWTTQRARLLVASTDWHSVQIRLHVIETIGFDPAAIRIVVGARQLPVTKRPADPGAELCFEIEGDTFARHKGSVILELTGPRAASFAELDPTTADHRLRSFAIRRFVIEAQPN